MKHLVSVIIPMYNSEQYIYDTVMSVLNQTYDYTEIIIIDDGSSDNSANIVNNMIGSYGEKIKYYYQTNSGVSVARNNGIQKASGKYVAFIDSDDLWLETKLEKQMEVLEKKKMRVCYCGFSSYYENEKIVKNYKMNFMQGKILFDFLKDKTWCWTSTCIIDRKLVIDYDLKFHENCSWGEDFEFFIKIVALTEVCCVNDYLVLYRVRENSLTTGNTYLDKMNETYVWIRLAQWLEINRSVLIYKDMKKIKKLILGFRIPNSIVDKIYNHLKSLNNVNCSDDINKIHQNLQSKYIKSLKFNNGIRTLKIYIKLIVIYCKLHKYKSLLYKIG